MKKPGDEGGAGKVRRMGEIYGKKKFRSLVVKAFSILGWQRVHVEVEMIDVHFS